MGSTKRFFRSGGRHEVARTLSMLIAISLPACAADGSRIMQDEQLEAAGWDAVQAGDFGRAIEMVLPMADAGEPEAEFAVGDLALLWLKAEAPKEPPKYTLDEAVAWIRKAAAKNLPQAAGFLRSGYEWGRYTLPKNAELAECWRRVEDGEQSANVCLAAEKSVN